MKTSCSPSNLEKCKHCATRVAVLTVFGNLALGLFKVVVGMLDASASVTADGIQSFACAVVAIFVMLGIKIARKPADLKFPYGYGKAEFLVSIISYTGLFGLGIFVFVGSVLLLMSERVYEPKLINIPVAFISIIINYMMYRYSACAAKAMNSAGLQANAKQNFVDMLTSCGVAVGVSLSQIGGAWHKFDTVVAIIIGLIIMKEAASAWWADLAILIDSSAPAGTVKKLRNILSQVAETRKVVYIKARSIGKGILVDMGIEVSPTLSVSQSELLSNRIVLKAKAVMPELDNVNVYLYPATEDKTS
ncbi:MAG: cation transporter [Fibrobacteria bacterium]|nr:cation transporter [Fibrobacteria bacterium]